MIQPTPDCPDHHVGANTLTCLTCGWDAWLLQHTSDVLLSRMDVTIRRRAYEAHADALVTRPGDAAMA